MEHLSTDLLSPTDENTELTKQMKQRCKTKILQQYESSDIKKLLDIATFLDPRFKHCKDDEEKKKEIEEAVKIEMLKASDCVDSDTNNEAYIQDNEESSGTDIPAPKRSKLGKFLGKRYGLGNFQSDGGADGASGSGMSLLEKPKNEMTMYLQYPQLDIADCPLDWWKKEAVHLPMLSTLAKKFLCICATSVSSERAFSTGGNIVTSKRNSLKPHVVDQLVF